ncbi:MAG: ABC transporter permease [Aquabacterium sp.]|jgi:putative spermidine/putrescine transport system permease protein|nr:MAG: ABC transporter permease [Aquabacterium sp.]
MLARYKPYLQLAPLALVLLLFVAAPLVFVLIVSFFRTDGFDTVAAFSLENYASVLGSRLTLQLYLQMAQFAFLTWFFSLVIGFFVAYFLVFHVRNRTVAIGLFLVCTVPFWTSNVIRMISWLPMLGQHGVVNSALMAVGVIDEPLRFLLFSDFAVVLAYVHLFTIFMIVPIFNSMSRIDRNLFEAALDAGASRLQTLLLVVLPLCKSGIALGSIFVVTLVMGDFYVVKVMSGGGSASVVSAMYDDVSTLLFPHASASAVLLLIVLTALVALVGRFIDVRRELVSQR